MPSKTVPSAREVLAPASAKALAARRSASRSITPSSTKKVSAPAARPIPTAPSPPSRSPPRAKSKLTALISAPAPKPRTKPTRRAGQGLMTPRSAPMASAEAARTPQPNASIIAITPNRRRAVVGRPIVRDHSAIGFLKAEARSPRLPPGRLGQLSD